MMLDGNGHSFDYRVEITGLLQKKSQLKAVIRFLDRTPDGTKEISYRWFNSDKKEGTYSQVIGAYQDRLPLAASSVGRYYKCEVTVGSSQDGGQQTVISEAAGPIGDVAGNPNTDWLLKAKYGISHHLLAEFMNRVAAEPGDKWQPGEAWDDVINGFDVNGYVQQVVETGAGFVILTLGQNSGYLLSPNETYDRIAGVKPGERASTRDLPMEIADALAPHGIKLILYSPANPPSKAHKDDEDFAINKAFDYPVEIAPSQETQAKWQAVIQEWSDRYGDKVAGWWFDGMWFQDAYNDLTRKYNWYSLVNAAKSGNVSRIIAFNSGIGSSILVNSPFEDYIAGETNEIGPLPHHVRWADEANGVQWFHWTFLGEFVKDLAGWGNTGLSWSTPDILQWVTETVSRQGVIALDIHVNRFGRMDPQQMEQLKALKENLHQLN
ncbi:alpha-L-fucosidase [Paenibacillus nasutitermitis]|uniref:alpha-L-fucosidase n=1 Tax=Paenibacillus nasutitermitis TaxID=1652958 RepID=A0A917E1R5_9BACL|nr:alpha-L-fucosidase [Paenibacillus nasutitermitis]GGD90421.1 hypothetical protein GCM10010911_56370 [Paenibacillus nasutitermitis]